jgi:hypothetical protein
MFKVGAATHKCDRRGDYVGNKRAYDLAKSASHNDTDRKLKSITLNGKTSKLFKHTASFFKHMFF